MSFDLPTLPDGWTFEPLESCAAPGSISYGVVQPGAPVAGGVPIIRVNNFKDMRLDLTDVMQIAPEVEAKYGRTRLSGGEVLLTLVGSVGEVAEVPDTCAGFNVARAVGVIRPRNGVDAKWLAICLRSPLSQHLLGTRANTTVQTTINLKDVRALPIPIPPLVERKRISDFVAALDDRIALLHETNASLEAIAQALFKSWFVDFDPVRAKQKGLAPAGMDEATAALFPHSFEDSALGLVPRGWRFVSLREVVTILDSKRVPLSGQERAKRKGEFPYYGAAALMDHVDAYLYEGVHVLMGEDGSVTYTDGRPILQYVWSKFWVNNHAHVLQGKDGICTEHIMLSLRSTNIQHLVTGAVQAKLSQANMWRIQFMRPSTEVAEQFQQTIGPLYDRFRQNAEQARTLAILRDTLLPRLISGQLRLPEAETLSTLA